MNDKDDKSKLSRKLSAYLDGELPDDQARRLAERLETDADLKAELDALAATRDLLRQLPRETAPEGLLDAVTEQLERKRLLKAVESPAPATGAPWVRWAAVAAVLALTAGLAIYLQDVWKSDWVEQIESRNGTGREVAGRIERDEMKRIERAPARDSQPAAEIVADAAKPARHLGKGVGSVAGGSTSKVASAPSFEAPRKVATPDVGRPTSYDREGQTAGPRAKGVLVVGQEAAGVRTLELNTTDLAAASRQVRAVLADNNITGARTLAVKGVMAERVARGRANVAIQRAVSAQSNQIVFFADSEQVDELLRQIRQVQSDQVGAVTGELVAAGSPTESLFAEELAQGAGAQTLMYSTEDILAARDRRSAWDWFDQAEDWWGTRIAQDTPADAEGSAAAPPAEDLQLDAYSFATAADKPQVPTAVQLAARGDRSEFFADPDVVSAPQRVVRRRADAERIVTRGARRVDAIKERSARPGRAATATRPKAAPAAPAAATPPRRSAGQVEPFGIESFRPPMGRLTRVVVTINELTAEAFAQWRGDRAASQPASKSLVESAEAAESAEPAKPAKNAEDANTPAATQPAATQPAAP